MASAALLWSCYFPLAQGWLGWVALVPLLCLARSRARARGIYLCAFVCGMAFFLPSLRWMPVADNLMYFAWAGLSLACAAFFPAALFLVLLRGRSDCVPA